VLLLQEKRENYKTLSVPKGAAEATALQYQLANVYSDIRLFDHSTIRINSGPMEVYHSHFPC